MLKRPNTKTGETPAQRQTKTMNTTKADRFLADNGLRFRATLSDTKAPAWSKDGRHGHHYRVTISRTKEFLKGDRHGWYKPKTTFDFWGSIADATTGKHPHAYDVLACISSDANCPDTFEEFCNEYGDDSDSITALQTFRRCSAFAKRLRAFFTEAELDQLSEIQ